MLAQLACWLVCGTIITKNESAQINIPTNQQNTSLSSVERQSDLHGNTTTNRDTTNTSTKTILDSSSNGNSTKVANNIYTHDILAVVNSVKSAFPEEPRTALAITKAESGFNPLAKGWNCFYGGKSAACQVADRANAWSVDCGLMQINVHGLNCPKELMEVEPNLKAARRKYASRHWQPWSAYTSGKYLAYLE